MAESVRTRPIKLFQPLRSNLVLSFVRDAVGEVLLIKAYGGIGVLFAQGDCSQLEQSVFGAFRALEQLLVIGGRSIKLIRAE